VSESAAPRRGALRAFAIVVFAAFGFAATLPVALAAALPFATILLFATTFALPGAGFFAFTAAEDFALAFAFFGAGFRFFDFFGGCLFLGHAGESSTGELKCKYIDTEADVGESA